MDGKEQRNGQSEFMQTGLFASDHVWTQSDSMWHNTDVLMTLMYNEQYGLQNKHIKYTNP